MARVLAVLPLMAVACTLFWLTVAVEPAVRPALISLAEPVRVAETVLLASLSCRAKMAAPGETVVPDRFRLFAAVLEVAEAVWLLPIRSSDAPEAVPVSRSTVEPVFDAEVTPRVFV